MTINSNMKIMRRKWNY